MREPWGPIVYGGKDELVFWGREINEQRNYSDKTAEEIDEEVKRFVDKAYATTKRILTEYRDKLQVIAQRLLTQQSLNAEEFSAIFETEEPPTSEAPPLPA